MTVFRSPYSNKKMIFLTSYKTVKKLNKYYVLKSQDCDWDHHSISKYLSTFRDKMPDMFLK